MTSNIYNIHEVADLAGVSESTVRRAFNSGVLVGSRIGAKILRFTSEDIQRWMSSTSTATPATKKGKRS